MFDDVQPPKSGSTPPNLPLAEPEDIFDKTDSSQVSASVSEDTSNSESTLPSSTALDAGVLKPKTSMGGEDRIVITPAPAAPASEVQRNQPLPQSPQPVAAPYTIQTPSQSFLNEQQGMNQALGTVPQEAPFSGRKILIFISIVLILIVLGFGSLWIYTSFIKKNTGDTFATPTSNTQTNTPTPSTQTTVPTTPSTETTNPPSTNPSENSILFGEPVDTDSDGIVDVDEAKYGTNTLNWDTDADELSDGDEVMIWKTDPRVFDTDGDGYGDGVEIKNGYNPSGTGKLFEPPTSTSATATTGTPRT